MIIIKFEKLFIKYKLVKKYHKMMTQISLVSQRSLSKSSPHSLLKDNIFFNFVYERTINFKRNDWNALSLLHHWDNDLKSNQLDPCSRWSIAWWIFISLFDMLYIGLLLPIIISFSSITENSSWSYVELICSIILIINLFVNFSIGYLLQIDSELILCRDVKISSYVYIRYGTFIVDLLSCVPSIVYIVFDSLIRSNVKIYKSSSIVFAFLLLVRFIRLLRVSRMLLNGTFAQTVLTYINVPFTLRNSKVLIAFILVYLCSSIVNILACIWFGIARAYGFKHTWIAKAGLEHKANFDNYIASLYFVVQSMTTVGYGDVSASNTCERAVAIIFMLTGVLLFLAVIKMLSSVFINFDHLTDTHNLIKKMEGIEKLGTLNTLDKSIKREIREHYQEYWFHEKETQSTWQEFIDDLPGSKKYLLIKSLLSDAVEHINDFKHLTVSQKAIIYANAVYIPFTWKEQELCFRGEMFEDYMLLVDGMINIVEDEQLLYAPNLIGKQIAREGFISNTLIAQKNCLVFKIKKSIIETLLTEIV